MEGIGEKGDISAASPLTSLTSHKPHLTSLISQASSLTSLTSHKPHLSQVSGSHKPHLSQASPLTSLTSHKSHLSQASGSHCECSEFQTSSASLDADGGESSQLASMKYKKTSQKTNHCQFPVKQSHRGESAQVNDRGVCLDTK